MAGMDELIQAYVRAVQQHVEEELNRPSPLWEMLVKDGRGRLETPWPWYVKDDVVEVDGCL